MVRNLAFAFSFFTLGFGFASAQAVTYPVKLTGQNQDLVKLQDSVKTVRTVPVVVNTTCTRNVQKPVKVCHDVEHTRQQCHKVPASSNRVCDTGTRQVCENDPPQEVCHERPTHEICHTDPTGTQHCTSVGGGTVCQTTGGGQSCHDEDYETNCHNETTPAHQECEDVPYTTQECGTEVQTVPEQYACQKVQDQDQTFTKKVSGNVEVQVLTNGLVEEVDLVLEVTADERGGAFDLSVSLQKEPVEFVVVKENSLHIIAETKDEIVLEGKIIVETLDAKAVMPAMPSELTNVIYRKKTQSLEIPFAGTLDPKASVDAALTNKGSPFAALQGDVGSAKIVLGAIGQAQALAIDLTDKVVGKINFFSNDMRLSLKLKAVGTVKGQLLNAKKPSAEKAFDQIKVSIK